MMCHGLRSYPGFDLREIRRVTDLLATGASISQWPGHPVCPHHDGCITAASRVKRTALQLLANHMFALAKSTSAKK